MFDLEPKTGEVTHPLPEELHRKLLDLISSAVDAINWQNPGTSSGMGMFLNDPESINFIAGYFGDDSYRSVAEKYPGLPLRADTSDEGIVVTIGTRPYKDGVPVDGPGEDGLPYAVSVMSFETAERILQQQIAS